MMKIMVKVWKKEKYDRSKNNVIIVWIKIWVRYKYVTKILMYEKYNLD